MEKYQKYLKTNIDESFFSDPRNKKKAQGWFDSLWREADSADRKGQKDYADGMRTVLHAFRQSFL